MSSKRKAQFERYKSILTHYAGASFNRENVMVDFELDGSPASNVITSMKKRGLIHVLDARTKSYQAVSGALSILNNIIDEEQRSVILRRQELEAFRKNPSARRGRNLPQPPKLPIMQMFDDLLAGVRANR